MLEGILNFALYGLPPLLVAVILHEIAHGYVAYKLGDPTAKNLGRLSLNPIVHIDLFMTIIIPGLLILSGSPIIFGGAKPVPVNPMNLRNPRKDMMWVAIAGPITNFVLLAIFFGLWYLFIAVGPFVAIASPFTADLFARWISYSMIINLVLALFNLIPVPPLDGGRIAVGLLPISLARPLAQLERYGLLIVVLLVYSGVFDKLLTPVVTYFFSLVPKVN